VTGFQENNVKPKLARQALIFALLGWPAADLAVVVGLLISGTAHASVSDWLLMLIQVGLIGTLAGLALWALYRLVNTEVIGSNARRYRINAPESSTRERSKS